MRLVELHQIDEELGEQIAKAIVSMAMAGAMGAVALGFATGNSQPDVEAETQRLIHNATMGQLARIRAALAKKSKDAVRQALDELRRQSRQHEK